MSLASVSFSNPGWSSIASQRLPPAQPAPDTAPAEVQSAAQLSREIEAQKESSLAYQLIRQLMIQESHSESETIAIDTDSFDFTLARSSSSSASLAVDENSLSFSWMQTDSFAATITGEGFSISIAGVRVQSMQLELERQVAQSDPLQIDLAGDGFETTGLSWSVRFDITGGGTVENVSVASDDDAVLALDSNRNGRIDSGRELFGDQHGRANGFAELRRHDDNQDAVIDASDRIFAALKLLRWHSDGHQLLQSLAEAGIAAISLNERHVDDHSVQGNRITEEATVRLADGGERRIADLWYRYMADAS